MQVVALRMMSNYSINFHRFEVRNSKLENALHGLFRPESACRELSKIGETVSLLLNADCSPTDKNLWGRSALDYIKHFAAIENSVKEQLVAQLSRDNELGKELLKAAENNDQKKLRALLDAKSRSGHARANFHENGRRAGKTFKLL